MKPACGWRLSPSESSVHQMIDRRSLSGSCHHGLQPAALGPPLGALALPHTPGLEQSHFFRSRNSADLKIWAIVFEPLIHDILLQKDILDVRLQKSCSSGTGHTRGLAALAGIVNRWPLCPPLQLPIIMVVAFSMCIICLLMAGESALSFHPCAHFLGCSTSCTAFRVFESTLNVSQLNLSKVSRGDSFLDVTRGKILTQ